MLDRFYSKDSFGYKQFSDETIHNERIRRESEKWVEKYLRSRPELCDVLSRVQMINVKKLGDDTGMDDDEAKQTLRSLSRARMLEDKGGHGYRVTQNLKGIASRLAPDDYNFSEETT